MESREHQLVGLGELIRKQRLKIGLTQEELADLGEFDRTYISLVERGHRNPSYLTLSRLAEAMSTPLWKLLKGG